MKIYTKRGDKGETSLIGGQRVPKYDLKVEAYGTLDELNSYLGLIADLNKNHSLINVTLAKIQKCIFVAESRIASDSKEALDKMPTLQDEDLHLLESEIDKMSHELPTLTNFILPGGHPLCSYSHIARTICRRAERHILQAYNTYNLTDEMVLKYVNRLSDYLFTLARYFSKIEGKKDLLWITSNEK